MRLSFSAVLAVLLLSATALAHHGAAAYQEKLTTMTGTVSEYQFMNPHAAIFFDVKDVAGNSQNWVAESVSAAAMSRAGWTRSTLKPGDQVTITGNVSKNGTHAMRLSKLVLPNGKQLSVTRGEDYAGQ